MGVSARYWQIWRINPASDRLGYKQSVVAIAQSFLQTQGLTSQVRDLQTVLLSYFQPHNTAVDTKIQAVAGLCLRCYVSEPILKACQKIDYLFAGGKHFSYQDLLPYVLNDDGQTLVIFAPDGKTQLSVNSTGEVQPTVYKLFSLKVLQTFNANSASRMSLDNWAFLHTKQHPEVKDFLAEFGFKHLSDWALLNRVRQTQLDRLSARDRHLVSAFHVVYRRDRVQQRQVGTRKCPDPSPAQLQEMLTVLQQHQISINSHRELFRDLKQVASQLRQYDIWSNRETLDIYDPDTGSYTPRPDLATDAINEADIEQTEFREFLYQQLKIALNAAIETEIKASITKLEASKKYAPLAKQFIPGLQMYYHQGLSLKEIAPQLGMSSWDQARRILNPGELLSKIRAVCVQQMLENILAEAAKKGLTQIPPKPDYLNTLLAQIEAFADTEIFQAAGEEIRAGKNRVMQSAYAQQLRLYLNSVYQQA